jgi:hypothetical protein
MLGPVFRFELITTARRKRYYVARLVYGLLLLYSLGNQYAGGQWLQPVTIDVRPDSIEELSRFARAMFAALAWAQGVALLCLVPALLAGVIADEAQRKTLHYLLASRMSSTEIVLGKLAARLLHVGVIVLMGVPMVCLLALLGGLDPWEVSYVYAGTFTLVFFLAGLSLLVSVLAPRPREAILMAYVAVFTWLFLPRVVDEMVPLGPPLQWVEPVNDCVLLMNPIHVWDRLTSHHFYYDVMVSGTVVRLWTAGANALLAQLLWMAGLQAAFGVVFLVLAIVGLRPLRGSEGGRRPQRQHGPFIATIASALRTRAKRPPCFDAHPMLWKERFAAGGGFSWLRSRPVALFLGVLLGCYLFDAASPAFRALLGWRWSAGWPDPQLALNAALRQSSTFLFILLLLSVASAAAVSLSSEREQDTWMSLAGTLLTGREIVVAKIRGAVWSSWRLVLGILIMWTVGLLAGGLFPLGVLAAVAELLVFCWFTAALGVWISARARNSTRALFATVFAMLALNGGYLILIAAGPNLGSDMACVGMMPYMLWLSLISYREGVGMLHDIQVPLTCLASLLLYGLGAALLTLAAVEGFEKLEDRPRRSSSSTRDRLERALYTLGRRTRVIAPHPSTQAGVRAADPVRLRHPGLGRH